MRTLSPTLFWYIFKDLIRIFALASGVLAGIMSFGGLLRPLTEHGLDVGQVLGGGVGRENCGEGEEEGCRFHVPFWRESMVRVLYRVFLRVTNSRFPPQMSEL